MMNKSLLFNIFIKPALKKHYERLNVEPQLARFTHGAPSKGSFTKQERARLSNVIIENFKQPCVNRGSSIKISSN
jgi:hypothetical protein